MSFDTKAPKRNIEYSHKWISDDFPIDPDKLLKAVSGETVRERFRAKEKRQKIQKHQNKSGEAGKRSKPKKAAEEWSGGFGGQPNLDRYSGLGTIKVDEKSWDELISAPARRSKLKADRYAAQMFNRPRKVRRPEVPEDGRVAVALKSKPKAKKGRHHKAKVAKREFVRPQLGITYHSPFSPNAGPEILPTFATAKEGYQAMVARRIGPGTLVQIYSLGGQALVLPVVGLKAFLG